MTHSPEIFPETFLYWCLKKIDTGAFKQDLSHTVSQASSTSDYNCLCSVLDKHPPLFCHTVHTRKPTPWISSIVEQFCELKREHLQVERRWLKSKLTFHKQIYDSIKQKITNLVDKAKQAYYSAKIQSSTTCKQLFQNFQHHSRQKYFFTSSFSVKLWWSPECLFWLLDKENLHHQKPFSSSKPSYLPWYLFHWKSFANFWVCHWWICLHNKQCTNQVLWTWSHSHHASL